MTTKHGIPDMTHRVRIVYGAEIPDNKIEVLTGTQGEVEPSATAVGHQVSFMLPVVNELLRDGHIRPIDNVAGPYVAGSFCAIRAITIDLAHRIEIIILAGQEIKPGDRRTDAIVDTYRMIAAAPMDIVDELVREVAATDATGRAKLSESILNYGIS